MQDVGEVEEEEEERVRESKGINFRITGFESRSFWICGGCWNTALLGRRTSVCWGSKGRGVLT